MRSSPRMLVVFTFATFLVVGAVVSLATGSWWALVIAMGAHALGTVFVLGLTGKALADTGDKPDPVTEARLEEEGSRDEHDDEPRMAI